MALTNLMTAITLDVYDHNATHTSIKSISCDSNTRFVRAALTYAHVPYKVSVNAAVALTVVRPDGAAVNIEGEAYNSGSANTDRIVAELTDVATAVKGSLLAQFKIEDGNQVLRTEVFKIDNGVALDIDSDKWADEYKGYDLSEFSAKIDDATSNLDKMRTASTSAVGKALVAKAVSGGKVIAWEFRKAGDDESVVGEVVYDGSVTAGGDSSTTYETVFDGTVTSSEENNSFRISSLADLQFANGEQWRVTLDGTVYDVTAFLYQDWIGAIGNVNFADGGVDDGTGVPFLLYNTGMSNALVGKTRTAGEHTLKLEKLQVSGNVFRIPSLSDLFFTNGDQWRVTLDDIEYDVTAFLYQDWIGAIGNVNFADGGVDDGTGVPFLLYNTGMSNALTGKLRTAGTHALKLEKIPPAVDNSNPLSGKIAAFTGDSVCYGDGYVGGYAKIIGEENNMTIQNLGASDGCIAPYSDSDYARFVISTSVNSMRSDANYIILEGGTNDAGYNVPLGALTEGFYDTLDTNTFAGAFEYMLKTAIQKFPTAKIGYIFVHKVTPKFDSRTTNSYYNIAKGACEKWGIPYCDLNTKTPSLMYNNVLKQQYTANTDGRHPTEQGYKLFYVPKITAWMKTL